MPAVTSMLEIGLAPAPAEVVEAVAQMEVETSLDEASVFRLRIELAQTDEGDWTVLKDDLFRPLVQVTIRVATGTEPPAALVNGYVSQALVTYPEDPGKPVLEVTGMDATMLMNLEEKVTSWPNLPDSAIAATILAQYEVVPVVDTTSPTLVDPEGTTIQRTTDARFLRKLARRNGFDFYVQPEPVTGIDSGYFRAPQPAGAPQAVLSVRMGDDTNVSGFSVRYDMTQPTTASANGLDAQTKSTQPTQAQSALQQPLGSEESLLRLDRRPVVLPVGTGLVHAAELQPLAQGIVDRSSWAVVAQGDVGAGIGPLRPGCVVTARGAGRLFNGEYYVSRVLHRIGLDGYTQHFEARRNAVGMTGSESFAGAA